MICQIRQRCAGRATIISSSRQTTVAADDPGRTTATVFARNSMHSLKPQQLIAENFRAYGEVIETAGHDALSINSGYCQRYSDLASIDICDSGVAGISLFDAMPRQSPIQLDHVERHPLGSQAFLPTSNDPYIVVVADDADGSAQTPRVFITSGYQGVNYHRNVWHGVLTPVIRQCLFVVVDYIGDRDNLEEHWFDSPYVIDYDSGIR